MRVRFAGQEWADVLATHGGQDVSSEFAHRLAGMLDAERFVVLTGLGTSLGVGDERGARLAPTMQDLWDEASQLKGFAQAKKLAPDAAAQSDIELLLSKCLFSLALAENATLRKFVQAAEARILARCQFVTSDMSLPTHELFLRKVARRSTRLPRTQLFTTNYDLTLERAAERAGFHLIDGFGLGEPRVFDGSSFDLDFVRRRADERPIFEPNVAQLFKLHGSVDWDGAEARIVRRSAPANPVLIYPAQEKFRLSYETPYLESMARFQMSLRHPDVALFVIGFGFNDAHITAPIHSAIQSNVGLRLVVVTRGSENTDHPSFQLLRELIARGDRRLAMVAGTFDDFVSYLPDLAPKDEREIHQERVRAAADVVEA